MTTKAEPTNEQVAEALGWEKQLSVVNAEFGIYRWLMPDGKIWAHDQHNGYQVNPPDFIHDLNPSWKLVWPEIVIAIRNKKRNVFMEGSALEERESIILDAWRSPNPAMYFATKLMELKGK